MSKDPPGRGVTARIRYDLACQFARAECGEDWQAGLKNDPKHAQAAEVAVEVAHRAGYILMPTRKPAELKLLACVGAVVFLAVGVLALAVLGRSQGWFFAVYSILLAAGWFAFLTFPFWVGRPKP